MKKLIIVLSMVFIVFMGFLTIYFFGKNDPSRWQVSLGGVFASALPMVLLTTRNPFPVYLIIGFYLFLFCSIFLGSVTSLYFNVKWWDSALHLYKGIYIGVASAYLYKLLVPETARAGISSWLIFLFVVSFSILSSAIWEIYEFIGDLTFTHTMQRGGNTDTMEDLVAGTAGAILAGIFSVKQRVRLEI